MRVIYLKIKINILKKSAGNAKGSQESTACLTKLNDFFSPNLEMFSNFFFRVNKLSRGFLHGLQ